MELKKRHGALCALISAFLLVLPLGGPLMAQGVDPAGIDILFYSGPSWSLGGGFGNVGSRGTNLIQPEAGVKISMTFSQRFRAGISAAYSRMIREQIDASLKPLSDGSFDGTVYRDFKTHFYSVGLNCEYALLKSGGPLELYAGSGAGCLFTNGNTWSLSVSNEMHPDVMTNKISIKGHNEPHAYIAPFVPLSLSLEWAVLPATKICLGGMYRFIFSGENVAPDGQALASLGLQLAF